MELIHNKKKACVICGFNKTTQKHHLQKHSEFGGDDDSNLVYLCPNHHWLADFGDEEDKILLLKQIKIITGKEPVINITKKEYYDKLIKVHMEDVMGEMSDEEFEKQKHTWNYLSIRKILLSRPGSSGRTHQKDHLSQLELKYLIKKLKQHKEGYGKGKKVRG